MEISPADLVWSGPAYDVHGNLTELGEDECLALLASVPVGRVLISVGALPSAFPVNHHVVDRTVVFRSSPGTKLTAAVDGQVVGFQAVRGDQPAAHHRQAGHARVPSGAGAGPAGGDDAAAWAEPEGSGSAPFRAVASA